MSEQHIVDCLVIGGGPAGLAAAIQLGRLRRSCILVDDDAGRSLWSQVTRNHLGFPDGIRAADLRLLGQRQAVGYDAALLGGEVVSLRRGRARARGFVATVEAADTPRPDDPAPGLVANRRRELAASADLGEGRIRRRSRMAARTVLLATGVVDAFPRFPGRDACVGVSLFWCIVCDGYESIGRTVVVVGDDSEAISTALGLTHFTDRVTLVTDKLRTQAPAARLLDLERSGVGVLRARVAEYQHEAGQIQSISLVRPGSGAASGPGRTVECERVFVSTPKRPRTDLARRLGASRDDLGYLRTDDAGRTSVPGLYAAGDATAGHAHQVTTAAHLGATAATAINFDLYPSVERALG